MKLLKRVHYRSRVAAGEPGPAEVGRSGEDRLPVADYEKLDPKQLRAQLTALSQVQLAAIERYEASHEARAPVLSKLHWLTGPEPLPGYDALDTEALIDALSGADAATLRAVRAYERRHRDRAEVRAEAERLLPTAPLSPAEDRAREEQAGLIRAGLAGRDMTTGSGP